MRRTNGNEVGMSSPFFLDFFLFFCSRPEPQVFRRRPRKSPNKPNDERDEQNHRKKRRKKTKREDEKVES